MITGNPNVPLMNFNGMFFNTNVERQIRGVSKRMGFEALATEITEFSEKKSLCALWLAHKIRHSPN